MPRTISPRVLWRKLYPMESLGQWKLMWRARGRTVTFEEQNEREGILVVAFGKDDYTYVRDAAFTNASGEAVLTLPDGDYWCRGIHHNFDTKTLGKKTIAGSDKTIEFTMVHKEADEVALTGHESVVADNESKYAEYQIELDLPLQNVPVTITTTFLAADIESTTLGDVADLVDEGIEILTDSLGVAHFVIEFAADVDKTANVVATIDDDHLHVATGGDSDTLAVTVDTEFKEANAVTLAGSAEILSDNDPVQDTYVATLDLEWAGVPVLFTTGFGADDIDEVAEGDVADLVGAGLEVLTGADGKASITITFAAGRTGSENIVAAIDDGDERVGTSDTGTVAVTLDTTADTTDGVTLTGELEIRADNAPVQETYVAELDDPIPGVPVTFTTDFLAGDIDSVSPGTVNAFVGSGLPIETDADGKATLQITFSDDVEKAEDITAAIDDEHARVSASDDSTINVDVDTRLLAAETVTLTGELSIVSDDEPVQEVYEAQLDLAMAGIPVVFTSTFDAEDIDAVEEGDVADLVAAGISVDTDATGKASLTITFSDDVSKTEDLTAAIDDGAERVRTSDDDTIAIVVDTEFKTADDVTLSGEENISTDNQRATEEYEAEINLAMADIPIKFSLATFSAGDIYAVDPGEVNDLLGDGIEVDTDSDGKSRISITFEAGVTETGNLSANIEDAHERISGDDVDTLTLVVDTDPD